MIQWLLFLCITICSLSAQKELEFSIEPTWISLSNTKNMPVNQRIIVATLSFKNKTNESIDLDHCTLYWQGKRLDSLLATLYEKSGKDIFLAIPEYYICDGQWHNNQQAVHFNLKKPIHLKAHTTFYIVLTVPSEYQTIINQGSFTLNYQTTAIHVEKKRYNNLIAFNNLTAKTENPAQ